LDYRTEFKLDPLVKFADINEKMREGKLCEENVLELEKNIQIDEEIQVDELHKRYVIPDKLLKLIGPCICMKCSGYRSDNTKIFRLIDTFYHLRDHCKKYHGGITPMGVLSMLYTQIMAKYKRYRPRYGANIGYIIVINLRRRRLFLSLPKR
jgi:hypothetical protein